jgi:hypothetical protein
MNLSLYAGPKYLSDSGIKLAFGAQYEFSPFQLIQSPPTNWRILGFGAFLDRVAASKGDNRNTLGAGIILHPGFKKNFGYKLSIFPGITSATTGTSLNLRTGFQIESLRNNYWCWGMGLFGDVGTQYRSVLLALFFGVNV